MDTQYLNDARRAQFAELDRLTLLCDNLNSTIQKLEQHGGSLEVLANLRQFLGQRLKQKIELQKHIITTAKTAGW